MTTTKRASSKKTPLVREPIVREFASRSGASTHTTTVTPGKGIGNKYHCTCMGFRRWSKCWHVSILKDEMGVRPNTGAKSKPASASSPSTTTTKKEQPVTKKSTVKNTTTTKENKMPKTTTATITAAGFEDLVLDLTREEVEGLGMVKIKKTRKPASASVPQDEEPAAKPAKKQRTIKKSEPAFDFPTGVLVNVKVKGEKTMRKNVVLNPHASLDGIVTVKIAGRRGRPGHLAVDNIEKVRAL